MGNKGYNLTNVIASYWREIHEWEDSLNVSVRPHQKRETGQSSSSGAGRALLLFTAYLALLTSLAALQFWRAEARLSSVSQPDFAVFVPDVAVVP